MSILSRALRDRFSSPPRKSASRRVSIHVLELESRRLLTGVLGWSGGVNLPGGETQVSAVTVGSNSSILLFGNGGSAVKQLNPGASAWTTAGPIDVPRNAPGAVELDNTGQLIVFGGYSPNDGSATDGVISYASGVVTQLTPLNTAREQFAYTTDGAFAYAIGGLDANGGLLNSVEQYDPTQDQWNNLAPLPVALYGAAGVYDGLGNIYVIGGQTAAGVSKAVYELNLGTNTWSTAASLPVAETAGAAILGADGQIDVIGGVGANGNSIATVQRFDPVAKTWSVDTPLPAPVSSEALALDSFDRVEVIGGQNVQKGVVTKSSTVYVTDLAPVFTSTAPASPVLVAGTAFSYTAAATGTPTPTFSLVNPPAGASINATTGAFTWTPTLNQTGAVTIDIRASNGYSQTDQTFQATVQAPAPTGLAVSSASKTTITLSWKANAGPVAYYRVYMDGQLPQYNIVADHVTGTSATIAGLTSQAAGHTFWVTSFDTAGHESLFSASTVGRTWFVGSLQYSPTYLSIAATHQLKITLSNPTANPQPTSYAIVSGAPAGMVLNTTTGVVTWTPKDSDALHGFFPIFSSTNAVGTVTVNLGISVQINYPAISVVYPGTTGSIAYANLPFSAQFSDSSGAPVTWTLNSAPAGVTLSSTGLLSWTPTLAQALASNTANITIKATNYAGSSLLQITPVLLTASAPGNLAYTVNKSTGTFAASWVGPVFIGWPVASYSVTLTYAYTVNVGGRGGSRTISTTKTLIVSGSTLNATFTGINYSRLPAGKTRFSIAVKALDAAGDASVTAVRTFTM